MPSTGQESEECRVTAKYCKKGEMGLRNDAGQTKSCYKVDSVNIHQCWHRIKPKDSIVSTCLHTFWLLAQYRASSGVIPTPVGDALAFGSKCHWGTAMFWCNSFDRPTRHMVCHWLRIVSFRPALRGGGDGILLAQYVHFNFDENVCLLSLVLINSM